MLFFLQITSSAFALFAAIFWFESAMGNVSPPKVGFGGTVDENDDFIVAFNKAMRLNRRGAFCAAVSVFFGAIYIFLDALSLPAC